MISALLSGGAADWAGGGAGGRDGVA